MDFQSQNMSRHFRRECHRSILLVLFTQGLVRCLVICRTCSTSSWSCCIEKPVPESVADSDWQIAVSSGSLKGFGTCRIRHTCLHSSFIVFQKIVHPSRLRAHLSRLIFDDLDSKNTYVTQSMHFSASKPILVDWKRSYA